MNIRSDKRFFVPGTGNEVYTIAGAHQHKDGSWIADVYRASKDESGREVIHTHAVLHQTYYIWREAVAAAENAALIEASGEAEQPAAGGVLYRFSEDPRERLVQLVNATKDLAEQTILRPPLTTTVDKAMWNELIAFAGGVYHDPSMWDKDVTIRPELVEDEKGR